MYKYVKKNIMKKVSFLFILLAIFSIEVPMRAQDTKDKSCAQKFIEENNIPKSKFEKFWVILEKNYLTYHPNENWEVISDTLAYVFRNDSCPMRNKMGMASGVLSHKDGKCLLAISAAFNPMGGRKLPIPYEYEVAKTYIFTYIANQFDFGKPMRSRTKQEMKDAEMLVTYYPADTAKNIFNGVSLLVYPLNFKGEYCQNKYRYGRGVVVLGKYNVPLYLYFFMTDESIVDFDKYLADLKGVFTFKDKK